MLATKAKGIQTMPRACGLSFQKYRRLSLFCTVPGAPCTDTSVTSGDQRTGQRAICGLLPDGSVETTNNLIPTSRAEKQSTQMGSSRKETCPSVLLAERFRPECDACCRRSRGPGASMIQHRRVCKRRPTPPHQPPASMATPQSSLYALHR